MDGFIEQLKKRNVLRAGVAYAVVAWIILQVAAVTFPPLGFPGWAMTLVVVLAVTGFPVTLVFSWLYEWTPEGFQRHETAEAAGFTKPQSFGRMFDFVIISLLVVAVGFLGYKRSQLEDLVLISPDAPSIAVLSFEMTGSLPEKEYFGDGLTEDILNRLASVPGLKVSARASSFYFKDKDWRPQEVGELLDVETVLDGRIEYFAGRVKISPQLVSTKTGTVLWADTMEGPQANIFDMQRAILEGVSKLLLPDQEPPDFEAPEATSLRLSLSAYTNYLQGLYYYRRFLAPDAEYGPEEMVNIAEDYFERATSLAPDFALGWALLADVKHFKVTVQLVPPELGEPAMMEALERALELDPELAEAHYVAYFVYRFEDRKKAFQYLQKAVEFKPNHAEALMYLSYNLFYQKQYAQFLETIERAFAIDPLNARVSEPALYAKLYLGDRDGVAEILPIVLDVQWDEGGLAFQTFLASQWGEFEEFPEFERRAAAFDDYREVWAATELKRFVDAYMTLGIRDMAESWSEEQFDDVFYLADGNFDEAVTFLESEVAKGGLIPSWAFRDLEDKKRSLIEAYLYAGRYHDFVDFFDSFKPAGPDDIFSLPVSNTYGQMWADIPYVYALMQTDETEKAQNWLAPIAAEMDGLLEFGFDFPFFHYELARVRMLQNRPEEAMVAFETAIGQGWRRWYIWLDPILKPLQDHPRFEALKATYDADIEKQRVQVLAGLAENQMQSQ